MLFRPSYRSVVNYCVVSLAAAWAIVSLSATTASAAEWHPLFNGKDLTGWTIVGGSPDSWKVADGILYCNGGGGGWLSTTKEYANFELELEFRVPPDGNSGVFIRAPREGNGAYVGMELQVLDDHAAQYAALKPTQYTGSVYDVAPAMPRVSKKAGEWQKMEIVCDGRKVEVVLNGTQIVDADLDRYPEKFKEHPGLLRKAGFIGLQNHDTRLDYRNLRIRELP